MRQSIGSVDVSPEEMEQGAVALSSLVKAQPQMPDIVAVHDPKETAWIVGRTPLILCGHMHRESIEIREAPLPPKTPSEISPLTRTIICNAGTTGAAGGRYFERDSGVPFSCAVLTFRRDIKPVRIPLRNLRPQLRAIDLIVLDGTLNQYSIRHTDINPTLLPKPNITMQP